MRAKMLFGSIQVESEGDAKEVFKELASAAEVFGQHTCGKCKSKDVQPVVREIDGNTYYEMRCHSCGHAMGFGQRKIDGALYPRRKDKDGNWLPNGGWVDRRQTQTTIPEPF